MMRLKIVALLACAVAMCCGMWGCSDRVEFKWSDGRGTPLIAGFVDDSLVVAYDCRGWLETTETWNGAYSEDVSCGHDRLLVYNYRVQEDGPRWTDSLTNERGGYRWYQLTDSIFWRWEGDDILLWKLGEKAHEIKISRKNEECSEPFKVDRMHQWLDGKFIALGNNLSAEGDSCQYAVLDTVEKTLTYKRLDRDLMWIQKCNDVRAVKNKVYCLQTVIHTDQIGHLIVDNVDQGKLEINAAIGPFWGNMLELGNNLCKLSNDGSLECLQVRWLGGKDVKDAEFIDEEGKSVFLRE